MEGVCLLEGFFVVLIICGQRFSCSEFGHFQLVDLHLLMTLLARNTETIITVLNA
jgi:hypothetical protein